MAQIRYDKHGRQLPDTGRGCGCSLCMESNAPRYERRREPGRAGGEWGEIQRRLVRMLRNLGIRGRSELA